MAMCLLNCIFMAGEFLVSFWVVVSVGDISDFFGHIISRLLSEWDVTVGF